MRHLKRLSKKFLEDRVHIRRIQREAADGMDAGNSELPRAVHGDPISGAPDEDGNRTIGNYTFDITFEREMRAGSNMEASARTSNADRNVMGPKDSNRFDS